MSDQPDPDRTLDETTDGDRKPPSSAGQETRGETVGPWTLISPLGEGGFGSVWVAERRRPFTQRVALKLIKPGMDSKAVVARFEQERQALAVMNHPGIAKVVDGGLTDRGRPYFAMELVKGDEITAFCDARRLGLEDRLRLFIQACEAVQHAHLKGLVHRDLKPSNILAFETEGGEFRLKVIDFGVAKAMSQPLTEKTIFTQTGHMIGTPEYMSPEQADPSSTDIDTRSDVYSLGVLLYEMIVGVTPFSGHDLRSKAYAEMQRILREDDPPRPSDRLSTISQADANLSSRIETSRQVKIAELARTLRSELEWIPMMAMRKEPQRRYQSAMALADDLRNYLDRKPLVAAPESTSYRVRKYASRHKALVTGTAAVAASLVAGLTLATWQWQEKTWQWQRAEANAAEARAERVRADERADAAEKAQLIAQMQTVAAVAAQEKAEDLLTVIAIGDALDAARRSDPATTRRELAIVEELGRGDRFDARLARAMSDRSIGEPLRGHENWVTSVSFSPDGTTLASGGSDKTIRLWDVATGQPIGEPLRGHERAVSSVSFSPDGTMLASGSWDKTIRFWDLATGRQIGEPLRGHEDAVSGVSFSPDGTTLASGDDYTIRLWDVATGRPIGEPLRGHELAVSSVSFSPDGTMLASGSWDKTIRLWDAATGRPIGEPLRGHENAVWSVSFSHDGTTLASGSSDNTIRLWDLATGRPIGEPLRGHEDSVGSLSFSPDGTTLASGSRDNTIRLWNVATSRPIGEPLRGHEDVVWSVSFNPDGTTLASGSSDDTIRLWDMVIHQQTGEPLRGHRRPVLSVSFSPDSATLASGSRDNTIRLWDAATGQQIGEPLRGHEDGVSSVSFSPDGTTLASGSSDNTIRLWDTATGQPIGEPLRGHEDVVWSVSFSPDGTTLASGSWDNTIRLWDLATGRPIGAPLSGHQDYVLSVSFSPDGTTLASGSRDNTIRLWDVATGQPIGEPLRGHDLAVRGSFSPDGTTLASGSSDKTIRLWDLATGQPIGEPLRGHEDSVISVSFSPDGTTLASGGDKTIRLWNVATGRPIGEPLRGHESGVSSVSFSPDGTTLASGSSDNTIRLWHAVPIRDRIDEIRERRSQMNEVRTMLADRIARVGPTVSDAHAFAEEVRADPRFAGELRTAALLVVGELDLARSEAESPPSASNTTPAD